jgi:hypothetical protein
MVVNGSGNHFIQFEIGVPFITITFVQHIATLVIVAPVQHYFFDSRGLA